MNTYSEQPGILSGMQKYGRDTRCSSTGPVGARWLLVLHSRGDSACLIVLELNSRN